MEIRKMSYWVTTTSGVVVLGPYEDNATAELAARINLGLEGWTITET
jgi:hypothetical protein